MDQRIVAAFFDVRPRHDGVPPLETVLDAALAEGPRPADRMLDLSSDVRVRLERLNRDGEWVEGEMTRVQTQNIPPEAFDDGLAPSSAKSQGHSAVFRYLPRLQLLVVQKNTSGMTYSRIFRYLRSFDESARYIAHPVPNTGLWERFSAKKAKRFSITLVPVSDPSIAEGPIGAITESSRRMGDALDGATIHISVSAGSKEDGLKKGALRKILEHFSDPEEEEVTSLSVSAQDEEGEADEVINFLDDVLKETGELLLDDLSSEESYKRRIDFLRDCYNKHMDYIIGR